MTIHYSEIKKEFVGCWDQTLCGKFILYDLGTGAGDKYLKISNEYPDVTCKKCLKVFDK